MTREDVRARFSDYLENALSLKERDQMQAYLAAQPEAAAELIALERTLSLLHRLPEREPSLDLWRELLPEIEAFRAERRQTLPARLRGQWAVFMISVSEGIILWTHTLAHRAQHRFGPHLYAEKDRNP